MRTDEIIRHVDYTLLGQTAGWEEIRKLCDKALEYHTASVCIPPSYVRQAKEYVGDKMAVCTVIGFPNGYNTTEIKAAGGVSTLEDAEHFLELGADRLGTSRMIKLLKGADGKW